MVCQTTLKIRSKRRLSVEPRWEPGFKAYVVCRTIVMGVYTGPLDPWVVSEIGAQIMSISKVMGTPKKGVWILIASVPAHSRG